MLKSFSRGTGRWRLVGLLSSVLCLLNPDCTLLLEDNTTVWHKSQTCPGQTSAQRHLTDTKALGFSSNCRSWAGTKGKEPHGTSWQKDRGLIFILWGISEHVVPENLTWLTQGERMNCWTPRGTLRRPSLLWLPYTFRYTFKSQPQRKCCYFHLLGIWFHGHLLFLKIESQTKNKICLKGRIISRNQGLTWDHFEDKTLFGKLWFHSGCNPLTPPSLKIAKKIKRRPSSSHPPDTAALSLRRRAVKGENSKNRLPSPDFKRTLNEPHKLSIHPKCLCPLSGRKWLRPQT